jgi:Dolichyl-phosphate-mannose-protein mannosyltransferase
MEQVTATDIRRTPQEARRPDPGRRPDSGRRPDLNGHPDPGRRQVPSRPPDPSRPPVPGRRPGLSRRLTALVAAAAGLLTLVIRLALHGNSFDLFGDEVIYSALGRSVVDGGFPSFYGPFFLHGPAFFYLEAGWARLYGTSLSGVSLARIPSDLIALIYEMRTLNAVIAAATAVVLVLLGTRVASLWSGAAAGLLFALDPFCIRQNDRVLLETALMLWVMLGYLVFTTLIDRPLSRGSAARAVLAGLFFGFAVLTKDEGALLTLLPLLAAIVLRWGPDRRLTLITIVTIVDVYVAYVTAVAGNGYFRLLWRAKTAGIARMLGVIQTSGFHSSGGGSLKSRLFEEANFFGTTYLLLAVAVVAALVLLRRGGNQQRMLGLLYCAAGVTLAYAVGLGTLEEQELYLLIVPSLLIIPVAVTVLRQGRKRPSTPRKRGMAWTAVPASALVLILGINLSTAVQWMRQPDDGFARLAQYVTAHVPAGTAIGAIQGDIESPYALGANYNVGYWDTSAALTRAHARYVVVEWGPVEEGYSDETPAQVRQLVAHGTVVFSFDGRTYGDLELYQLPSPPRLRPSGQSFFVVEARSL